MLKFEEKKSVAKRLTHEAPHPVRCVNIRHVYGYIYICLLQYNLISVAQGLRLHKAWIKIFLDAGNTERLRPLEERIG